MSGTLLGPKQAMRARDSEKFNYTDNFFGGRERCDTMKKTKRGSGRARAEPLALGPIRGLEQPVAAKADGAR